MYTKKSLTFLVTVGSIQVLQKSGVKCAFKNGRNCVSCVSWYKRYYLHFIKKRIGQFNIRGDTNNLSLKVKYQTFQIWKPCRNNSVFTLTLNRLSRLQASSYLPTFRNQKSGHFHHCSYPSPSPTADQIF